MMKNTTLPIAELVRRTGISARTLRFYETLGLLTAQRTASGHRCYGPLEMARLHQISALKKAGFSLSDIDELLRAGRIAAADVIATQLAALATQRAALDSAHARLTAAQTLLADGIGLSPQDFCDLITQGERIMTTRTEWDKVTSRYFSAEDQAHWAERMQQIPAEFQQADYAAKWADLGSRIKAAMPMDVRSDQARAYLAEWQALLAPFNAVADDKMKAQTVNFYEHMDEWQGDASPGFDADIWRFIRDVAIAAKAEG
jgi:MerR family transcriptional regulator, thiopeptide resistance regulator